MSSSQLLPADAAGIGKAAAAIREGRLVAFPTETVYGLGADATDDAAVAAVFAAKGRPRFNPLIVHVPDAEAAAGIGALDARARAVAARFWPGPLTLVLPRAAGCPVSLLASAGLDTVALRVPAHAVAQAFLRAAGRPVVAPSANRSGAVSPTTAQHVAGSLGGAVDLILDGGPCPVGIESTVLDLTGNVPVILRPGGVPEEALAAAIGPLGTAPAAGDSAPLPSPGMMNRHYAPDRPVRLNALEVRPEEALLAFGPTVSERGAMVRNLSPAGDLREAAANLFRMLRELDATEAAAIAVMPIPDVGLGRAINDRLRRAAAPRE